MSPPISPPHLSPEPYTFFTRWAAVASQLRGRSEHSVRNRFHRLQRRKARAGARGRPEEEGEARAEGGGGAAAGRCVETARVVVALIWDGEGLAEI